MEPIKYYSIWCTRFNSWTTGFRRVNGILQAGHPNCPWVLTKEELEQWIRNDWGSGDLVKTYRQEIREIPAEDVEGYKVKRLALDEEFRLQQEKRAEAARLALLKREDDRRRTLHAEKYF